VVKRSFDFLLALSIAPFFLLLFPFVALLISVDSNGPVLFCQTRIGLKRRPFNLYKFRTMALGTGDLPSHEAGARTMTRTGSWLRRTKIDELPQIVNVLRGEMSFVGPRPCLPSQTKLIEYRSALGVFDLKPGITGIAQIQGVDMSDPALLATRDAEYLNKMSLRQDLAVIFATAVGRGRGDAARNHL
jgi:O-antigen biosynthesis protein WbqP